MLLRTPHKQRTVKGALVSVPWSLLSPELSSSVGSFIGLSLVPEARVWRRLAVIEASLLSVAVVVVRAECDQMLGAELVKYQF